SGRRRRPTSPLFPYTTLFRSRLTSAVILHCAGLEFLPEGFKSTTRLFSADDFTQATYLGVVKTSEDLTDTHNLFLVDQAAVRLRQNLVYDGVNFLASCAVLYSDILASHAG